MSEIMKKPKGIGGHSAYSHHPDITYKFYYRYKST